jgi:hypothetical protein
MAIRLMGEMPMQPNLPPPASNVGPQPSGRCSFVEGACCKIPDGLSGIFLGGLEVEAVEFEEQNPDYKTGPLVAIDEGMVAENAGCVKSGHCDDVGIVGGGVVLAGTGQSGLQQPSVAQSRRTAMDGYQTAMDRQDVAFLDPERFFLSSTALSSTALSSTALSHFARE